MMIYSDSEGKCAGSSNPIRTGRSRDTGTCGHRTHAKTGPHFLRSDPGWTRRNI